MKKVVWVEGGKYDYTKQFGKICLGVNEEMYETSRGVPILRWFPYIEFYRETITLMDEGICNCFTTKEKAMRCCEKAFKMFVEPLL